MNEKFEGDFKWTKGMLFKIKLEIGIQVGNSCTYISLQTSMSINAWLEDRIDLVNAKF